jgi:hypothetical protein
MLEIKTIKMPQNIALNVCNNARLKKALSIYLVLKALDSDGAGGLHYGKFIIQAETILKVHEKTVRNWLNHAKEAKLIEWFPSASNNYDGFYKLISWEQLSELHKCERFRFNYVKIDSIQFKFEYIIDQQALKDKMAQCKKAALVKYNYSLVKEDLKRVVSELGITTSFADLRDCQQFDFLTAGLHIHDNQKFFVNVANPDINIGYKKMSAIYGYSSIGGMAYKKRQLQKYGLIDIKKRQLPVELNYARQMKTTQTRETKLGNTAYFRPLKTIVLTLCDDITPQPQTNWRTAPPLCLEKI